jgi:hypothetical protein
MKKVTPQSHIWAHHEKIFRNLDKKFKSFEPTNASKSKYHDGLLDHIG